jgi:MFS family permease
MNANGTKTAAGLPFDPRRASALLVIFALMALMVTYVETMVLPAFDQFYTFFHLNGTSSFGTVAWILSAYLLVGTVVVPIFGKLGDLYGKKRMLMVAMSVYAVAVSIAGFTPNLGAAIGLARPNQIYLLIAVRAVQGIGMGMFPLAFAMIPEAFPAARVAQGQGIISAMFAAGAAMGLALGGWLAQSYGWQITYHTVIPLAVILVVLAGWILKESPVHGNPVLDLPGVSALGFGLATLLVGVTEGTTWGWGNFIGARFFGLPWGVPEFLIVSVVAFAFFALWEQRAKSPVIRFEALKPRNILVSNVNGVIVGSLMFFAFTTIVILAELNVPGSPGLGVSEFTFGLLALPSALSMLASGWFVGQATSRWGPKPVMLLGFALMVVGGALLLRFHASTLELAAEMVPLMVGNVATLIAMSNIIVLSVDPRDLGIQTGMNQTFRNLGTAIAPVVTTSVLGTFTATFLVHGFPVSTYSNLGFEVVFAIIVVLALVGLGMTIALRNFRFLADGTRSGHVEPTVARPSEASAPRPTAGSAPARAPPPEPALAP